jgi:hypothetical protein
MTRVSLIGLACVVIGCGIPTGPASTNLVTIVPATDLLTIGGTETFSAFAAHPDGSGSSVTPTWTTDNPAVVSVSGEGLVTGLTAGAATITATYQNVSGNRALRVVPSFAGSWSGGYQTVNCTGNSCQGPHQVGSSGTVAVFLSQTREQVRGFVFIDGEDVPVSGSITTSGVLSLTGDLVFQDGGTPAPYVGVRVESWTSTVAAARTLTGRFTHIYADTSKPFPFPLSNRVESELRSLTPIGPP